MVKDKIRINKFLAQCNCGSRRGVEELILNGKIKVNDKICKELSTMIDPENDKVLCNNQVVSRAEEKLYLMLNKPKGYLVTADDQFERKTVYDLIPDFGTRLFYIGRLDYQSEGLLLLTNDGEFSNKIIHPKYKLPKIYKVTINGVITKEQIDTLRNGIFLDGEKTLPAKVYVKSKTENNTVLRMTIFEGKKRQIRRMIKHIGFSVIDLKRLQIGNLKLGKLSVGMWRPLTRWEVNDLKRLSKIGKKN